MAVALFGAAYVRGYSGFGMAALVVSSASLVTNPLHFVPVVLICDILLTVAQARGIRPDIDWRRVLYLFGGAFIGVPLGIWLLAGIGVDAARAVISTFILIMCAILWAGWHMREAASGAAHFGIGIISGLTNGAAVGGLSVAAFFAAQPIRAAAFRATLIAYFTLLDLWTVPLMGSAGMVTADTLKAVALSMPVLLIGLWLGSRHFFNAAPENFRRFAILLLAVLSLLGLWKALA